MKNLLTLLLILSSIASYSQSKVSRGARNNTNEDYRIDVLFNLYIPRYTDTIAANANIGIDSCGAKIFTYNGGKNKEWTRYCSPKRWVLTMTYENLTLTTQGTAGPATLNRTTGVLNIPNYAVSGGSGGTGSPTLVTWLGNQYSIGNGGSIILPSPTTTQVIEAANLYFTVARARGALSLTTNNSSGAATYDPTTGKFNIPNYTYNLPIATATTLGGVRVNGATGIIIDPSTGQLSVPLLTPRSVPFAGDNGLLTENNQALNFDGTNLNAGANNSVAYSGVTLNNNRGAILSSDSGTVVRLGNNSIIDQPDIKKKFFINNLGHNYLKIETSGTPLDYLSYRNAGYANMDWLPSKDNYYDLGNASLRWRYINGRHLNVDSITINGITYTTIQKPISLTTTGSIGPATFNPINGVLNIPNYSLSNTGNTTNGITDTTDVHNKLYNSIYDIRPQGDTALQYHKWNGQWITVVHKGGLNGASGSSINTGNTYTKAQVDSAITANKTLAANYKLPYNSLVNYYLGGDSSLHLLPSVGSTLYKLPYNGNTNYYLGGDTVLHVLPTIPTTTSQLTNNSGFITTNQPIIVTATGDATGTSTSSSTAPSLPLVLATVNSNVGTFNNITINAKGLATAGSNVTYATPAQVNAKLDTSGNYINNIVLDNSGLIHTSPATYNYTNHTATLTQILATQNPYSILGNNTGSTAAPTFFTNPYGDSLRRVGTTVSRRVNGNWIPQFTDSVGTGGSGGMAIGGTVTSGKTQSVLYIGTGGVLAQDTSYFKYNETNKTLQIDSTYITEGKNRNTGNLALGRNEPSTAVPLASISTGLRNTGLGASVLTGLTSANDNTAFGYQALRLDSSGINNVAIGTFSLAALRNGSDNVGIGQAALNALTTGYSNVAIGTSAGATNTGITNSTMLGFQAAQFSSSGDNNVFIGQSAGRYASSFYSIGIGSNVSTIGGGTGKVAIGYNSGYSSTGDYTTYLGYAAGQGITTGARNTIIGGNSSTTIGVTTGSANTIIGANLSGLSASLSNTVILADGDGNKKFMGLPAGTVRFGSLTNTQISAISGQSEGDWVYSLTDHTYQFWNGTVWKSVITN